MIEEEKPKPGKDRKLLEDRKIAMLTIIDVLKAKKHFFYITVALTVAGTLLGHFLKVSTYEATSTLFIQNIDQPSAAEYLLNQHIYKLSRIDRIESYISHLNSDSFFMRVAEKIKFSKEFSNINILDPNKKSKLGLHYWKNRWFPEEKSVGSEIHQKFLVPIDKIAGFLRATVTFQSGEDSQFISIRVKTLSPNTSKLVANFVAEEFVAITNQHNLNEVKQVEAFVQEKKIEAEDKVKDLDQKLISFKQKHNIVSTDATTKNFADRLSNLESQIEAARLQDIENQKILNYLTKGREVALNKIFKDGSKTEDFATAETSYILQSKIDQLKREKSAYAAQGFNDTAWQVQKINTEIDSTVERLRQVVDDPAKNYASLHPEKAREKIEELTESSRAIQARITTLKSARQDLQKQLDLMPNIQQEYIQLQNQFQLEIENLTNLERKEKELEIQRISYKKEVRVDQLAGLPEASPSGSLMLKLIFSALAAMFLGLVIILGLESLDPTVKSRQDLYDCGVEFFGEVPYITRPEKQKKRVGRFQFGSPDDLICKTSPESIEAMSFKYMRARIESMRLKEKKTSQIITVSSALHNEGKSFITANLAISLAQLKRKVVLIDADLRRPSQSTYFSLSAQNGLIDLLSLKKDLAQVVVKSVYPNLDVISAGFSGPDSTELISSQKFRLLIEHLRNDYEYIVIDTPPTFAVVDAAIISSFADIPVLVSSFRNTRKADLYEAYNDLLQVSYKHVFGIINKATVSNSRIHYYGYPLYNESNEVTAFNKVSDDETAEFLKKLGKKSS